MLADYASKVRGADPNLREQWNRAIIDSFAPPDSSDLHEPEPVVMRRVRVDIAILSVTLTELDAVRDAFGISRDQRFRGHRHRRYFSARVWSTPLHRDLSVVVTATTRALNLHAVDAVRDLLEIYEPQVVFLVGIAAGDKRKVKRGDVVIPEGVYYYEPSKLTAKGEQPRPEHAEVNEELHRCIFHYDPRRTGFYDKLVTFVERLGPQTRPRGLRANRRFNVIAKNAMIASGEKSLADGRFLHDLRDDQDERLIVADEESSGFALACGNQKLWWAIFRGISDYGGPDRDKAWQYLGTGNAALCLRDFLEHDYLPPGEEELL
jgi:nucleoside phosphorylase